MRIEEHPFYVLGITARSSKREILERAETLNIQADPDRVSACRIQVTHPARRVDAEVSWFPGLSPSRIRRLTDLIRQDGKLLVGFDNEFSGLDSLWTFNALTYWLSEHTEAEPAVWETAIQRMAENFQNIDPGELLTCLNADRSSAGLPQIAEISVVEESLKRHGDNAALVLPDLLIRAPHHAQVLARVVEHETDGGESPPSDFIGRIVDRYQILIQPALARRGDRVAAGCERLISLAQASISQTRAAGSARIGRSISDLEGRLSTWGEIARPFQLLMKSRGLKDTHSLEVAKRVRSTSVTLANDFDLHREAQQITRILYDVFRDVPELAELLEQDIATLEGIVGSSQDVAVEPSVVQGTLDFGGAESPGPLTPSDAALPSVSGSRKSDRAPADNVAPGVVPELPPTTVTDLGLSEADTVKALEIFSTEGEEGLRRFLEALHSPASAAQSQPTLNAADGAATARTFVELCRSIRLECWRRVDGQDAGSEKNRALFLAAHRDYERKVSPWLAIICDTYRDDTPTIMQVRNAAAECLNSLAGGFICVAEFDVAQRLCQEALTLVINDNTLESEIKGQLNFILSEKQKMPMAEAGSFQKGAAASISGTNFAGKHPSTAQKSAQPNFRTVNNPPSRIRLVAIGIAALVAIPLLIVSIKGHQWQPNITGTGPTGRDTTAVGVPPPPPKGDIFDRVAGEAAAPHDPVSLPNGMNLMQPLRTGGQGTLKISNYTDHDAAVKLRVLNGRTIRFVYVRTMGEVTMSRIPPGQYSVQFASGRDWDSTDLAFREDQAFSAFDETLSFSDDGRFYSVYEITLHTVPGGNIRKRTISASDFADSAAGNGNGDRQY